MRLLSPFLLWLTVTLAGCATLSRGNAPGGSSIATTVGEGVTTVPASVAWPTSIGGLAMIGAGIFCWLVLGNRRRALLMIATGILCAVIPPVLLEVLGKLVWPVVVLTSVSGAWAVFLANKWAWEKWGEE